VPRVEIAFKAANYLGLAQRLALRSIVMAKHRCLFRAGWGLAAVLLILSAAPTCRASLLPYSFDPAGPAVLGFNGSLSYDAATGHFHSETNPLTYHTPGSPGVTFFTGTGNIVIDLFVNTSGGFVSSSDSSFRLTGNVTRNGVPLSGDLLFGRITAFGADTAGPPTRSFNGIFDIQGGALSQAGDFPLRSTGLFLLSAENSTGGTLGDFSHNFSSSQAKTQGGVVTPEPSGLALGLIGAAVCAGWVWTRKRAVRLKVDRGQGVLVSRNTSECRTGVRLPK
jgi:hypothetical protein